MAIKIINPGRTQFNGFCERCGCEFAYEISDLKLRHSDTVACPTCGKDYYHKSLAKVEQNPHTPYPYSLKDLTWPPDPIPCTPDMTKTDVCAGCTWRDNLLRDGLYVGDTPCTWCRHNEFSCTTSGGAISSAVPCPEAHLNACTTSASECEVDSITTIHSASELEADREYVNQKLQEVYDTTGVKADDIAQGTVMNTILNTCHDCISNLNKCGDAEDHNSCSGEHKCSGKKNCKGKH